MCELKSTCKYRRLLFFSIRRHSSFHWIDEQTENKISQLNQILELNFLKPKIAMTSKSWGIVLSKNTKELLKIYTFKMLKLWKICQFYINAHPHFIPPYFIRSRFKKKWMHINDINIDENRSPCSSATRQIVWNNKYNMRHSNEFLHICWYSYSDLHRDIPFHVCLNPWQHLYPKHRDILLDIAHFRSAKPFAVIKIRWENSIALRARATFHLWNKMKLDAQCVRRTLRYKWKFYGKF